MQSVRKSSSLLLLPPVPFRLLQNGFFPQAHSFRITCSIVCSPHSSGQENLVQHRISIVCSFLQGTGICLAMVLSTGYREYLLCHGLFHRLQGNICSSAWALSSPSSSSWPWSLQDCLLHFFSSSLMCRTLSSLKYFFTETPLALLVGLTVSCSVSIRAHWNWLCPTWEQPLLIEATYATFPLPKYCQKKKKKPNRKEAKAAAHLIANMSS